MKLCSFTGLELPSEFIIACLAATVTLFAKELRVTVHCVLGDNGCWTAQLVEAFIGLRNGEAYEHAVLEGRPVPLNEFVADLRFRHQEV
jgi:hypothetical protein